VTALFFQVQALIKLGEREKVSQIFARAYREVHLFAGLEFATCFALYNPLMKKSCGLPDDEIDILIHEAAAQLWFLLQNTKLIS
jgi:hypothetical protein